MNTYNLVGALMLCVPLIIGFCIGIRRTGWGPFRLAMKVLLMAAFVFSWVLLGLVLLAHAVDSTTQSTKSDTKISITDRARLETDSFMVWLIRTNILKLSRIDADAYTQVEYELNQRFKAILDESKTGMKK